MNNKSQIMSAIIQENLDYVMQEDYDRIRKGLRHNPLMETYTTSYIDMIIEYYQEREEYEKCSILLCEKNRILDHDINYYK